MPPSIDIKTHPGPQTEAMRSRADVLLMGGAAGGGKSMFLLYSPINYLKVPGFNAVIFRRTYPRIIGASSLWEQSHEIYPLLGGVPNQTELLWKFPSGATVRFRHLDHLKTLQDYHGWQICLLAFDELVEWEDPRFFFYMMSRNRSTCGIRPHVRASCNPDSEHWLRGFIDWWIGEDGYPVEDRSGVLRWFVRHMDEIHWFPTQHRAAQFCESTGMTSAEARIAPKSFTFIPSKLEDNPTLMKKNPEYIANLRSMETVDRERLLAGNWDIRPSTGLLFPRDKWKYVDAIPADMPMIRSWDKASTPEGQGGKARTAGTLVGVHDGRVYIVDCHAGYWGLDEREREIRSTADSDRERFGDLVRQRIEQEPGSGGKDSATMTVRNLAGHDVEVFRPTGDKPTRWKPLARQVQAGNGVVVKGDWDWRGFVKELDVLSGDKEKDKSRLKDCADSAGDAYAALVGGVTTLIDPSLLRHYTRRGSILLPINPDGKTDKGIDDRQLFRVASVVPASAEKQSGSTTTPSVQWSVMQIWDVWFDRQTAFLRFAWRSSAAYQQLLSAVRVRVQDWAVKYVLIIGGDVADEMAADMQNQDFGIQVQAVEPPRDVLENSTDLQQALSDGRLLLPEGETDTRRLVESEWLRWTGGSDNAEQVEAASEVARYLFALRMDIDMGDRRVPVASQIGGQSRSWGNEPGVGRPWAKDGW